MTNSGGDVVWALCFSTLDTFGSCYHLLVGESHGQCVVLPVRISFQVVYLCVHLSPDLPVEVGVLAIFDQLAVVLVFTEQDVGFSCIL